MADRILMHGDKMSVDHMAKLFQTWEPTAPSWWDSHIVSGARTQMLSDDTTVRLQEQVLLLTYTLHRRGVSGVQGV